MFRNRFFLSVFLFHRSVILIEHLLFVLWCSINPIKFVTGCLATFGSSIDAHLSKFIINSQLRYLSDWKQTNLCRFIVVVCTTITFYIAKEVNNFSRLQRVGYRTYPWDKNSPAINGGRLNYLQVGSYHKFNVFEVNTGNLACFPDSRNMEVGLWPAAINFSVKYFCFCFHGIKINKL